MVLKNVISVKDALRLKEIEESINANKNQPPSQRYRLHKAEDAYRNALNEIVIRQEQYPYEIAYKVVMGVIL